MFDYTIKQSDLLLIGDSEIEHKGLIDHHITSANDLYEIGIPQIVTQVFPIKRTIKEIRRDTDEEKAIDHVILEIKFLEVFIGKPVMLNYNSGREEVLYPNMALQKEKTYKSNLNVDVKITATAVMTDGTEQVREEIVKNFKLCKIPIMVGSAWCNTTGLSKEARVKLHEDPSDHGGYFIIKGVEWAIDCVENILFNKVRIFRNEGYGKEVVRAEYLSKPGDFYLNSDQFIVRLLNDGQLTVEIKREKMQNIMIPYYIIFRMLGWNTDRMIYDNIILDYNDPLADNIETYLNNAYMVKYNKFAGARNLYEQHDILTHLADEIQPLGFANLNLKTQPENYKYITNYILNHMDVHFLPHIGMGPESRHNKLMFLCDIIRKILLVHMGHMEPTDRDSYNSKRLAPTGTSYAKSFKTAFNASVIQNIRKKFEKDFKTMSFYKIDLGTSLKASVSGQDFEKSITMAITAGNKAQININKKARINRLSSQLLSRKNQLNVISTLRQVTTTSADSAKQSERASEMRRVHPSAHGYICNIHSPEGEKGGLNKQLAMFSFITKASSSVVIKDILYNDTDIINLDQLSLNAQGRGELSNVYVNGDWIGCCVNGLKLVKKYRKERRDLKVSPELTIHWDPTQDEVYFWTDVGRVIRPLLIVYNTQRDAKVLKEKGYKIPKDSFIQGLLLTKQHIKGLYDKTVSAEDLLQEGVIEYISAEEQENMYLADSFETLKENSTNTFKEYTHCDIPQAQLGITALTSPYAHHNQMARTIYQTNQARQTCGLFAENWPYRCDKDTFLQYYCETPLVRTMANNYLSPNGMNCIVAVQCYTSYNMEDSIIMNKGAIDRGLFNGCKFTFYKTELEKGEEFGNPDATNTMDIKSGCYDKLVNGIIAIGSVIEKNDAIIGKYLKISKNPNDKYQYADKSIIYKDDEPAVVYNVIIDRNEDDQRFCKVSLRKLRPVAVGDKFSQIGTSQVLTKSGWKEIQYLDINTDYVATLTLDGNLDYVKPSGLSSYEYDGDMYSLKSQQLEMFVTRNHKLYVKRRYHNEYELLRTYDVRGKEVQFKKWANNSNNDVEGGYDYSNILDELPNNVWDLSRKQARYLLEGVLDQKNSYYGNKKQCDYLTQLALHCGYSGQVYEHFNEYTNEKYYIVEVNKTGNEPPIKSSDGKYVRYKGMVYCLEIPDTHQHVFYSRETTFSPPAWTGNSSRSGNKGVVGLILNEEDMPATEDGMVPSLIINPHCIPSRMLIGALIEMHIGNWASAKAVYTDGTIFGETDIDSTALALEAMGLNKYGYHRLYSGITGEYIDTEIFMGPAFYQRLQKFTLDTQYAIARGPSDSITYQPVDGKSSHGGLRIGEINYSVSVVIKITASLIVLN